MASQCRATCRLPKQCESRGTVLVDSNCEPSKGHRQLDVGLEDITARHGLVSEQTRLNAAHAIIEHLASEAPLAPELSRRELSTDHQEK